MAYALGVLLVLLGAWLIVDRMQFSIDNARWHPVRWPWDSEDSRNQRLSSFGFVLIGVLFIAGGAYLIAVGARFI
ncbi:MAG TPA: hypothetical protein VJS19_13565 [Candidatus Dormibacteraeota bacterium]|nr:hypothetical protein [Candidatus Dormibacteraeota bacterium]